jgi:hypothetical protein
LEPTKVVYEEDPARARALCAADKSYFFNERAAQYVPPPSIGLCGATFFVHGLETKAGNKHVVHLIPYVRKPGGAICLGYTYHDERILCGQGARKGFEGLPSPPVRLRLFAGQADPNDASHFSIAYVADDREGVIDGWLMDDDKIKFKSREGTR